MTPGTDYVTDEKTNVRGACLRRPDCRQGLRRNLRNSIAEGSAFNLMVGLGETYFAPFVLALGLGEVASGLVSTIPLIAGAILQLSTPSMVARLGSYRKWVLICASLQAAAFLPFIAGALTGHLSLEAVFAIASVYWGFGMAGGPAWNSWMGTLVPSRMQTGFFTRRSWFTQVTALCGFLVGGSALRFWPSQFSATSVFALLFGFAFLCRCLSIYWLNGQSELVKPDREATPTYSPQKFVQRVRRDPALGRLFSYMLLVQLGAQIASPYFTPYMLRELNLSYAGFAVLIAVSYLTKICMLPRLGKLALAHGTRTLLWVGGIGIVSLPALWLISDHFVYLIVLQLMSGLFWGAYDLAILLLLLECIPTHERTPILAGYNFVNSVMVVVGSVTGGVLLHHFGANRDAYVLIFLASAVARGLTLFELQHVSHQKKTDWLPVVLRPLAFRPSLGFHGMPLAIVRRVRRRPSAPPVQEGLAESRTAS